MSLIRKVHIANGIYWVEIPDADLRICCGVPPDTVKFLRKVNYISTLSHTEIEAGPNAILLSDAMVQNHMLCNLGEFPVMQMLYMQGMLNNADQNPLVIGLNKVVDSQLEYIKRGNYGTYNPEEIAEAHNDNHLTPQVIHFVKQFFAKVKFPEKAHLCDTITLHKLESKHIKNNVYITRIGFNIFRIEHEGDAITVDLNLAHNDWYDVPYHLDNHIFKFNDFSVLHAGEGNGWYPDHPCMGSILISKNKLYCIDCGPNILNNLLKLGIDSQDIEGVFLTHIHDDHFAGITDLLKSAKKLKLYATPLISNSVAKKLAALLGLGDNVLYDFFEVTDLDFDGWNMVADFEVKPVFSPHPVETNVFHFRKLRGNHYVHYSHLADTISFKELEQLKHVASEKVDLELLIDKIKKAYLVKSDVKKVDVGGGKIHGVYEDYAKDKSNKIVYSHIDHPFYSHHGKTNQKISFGEQDILSNDAESTHLQNILTAILIEMLPEFGHPDKINSILNAGKFMKANVDECIQHDGKKLFVVLSGCLYSHNVRFGKRIIYDKGSIIGLFEFESYSANNYTVASSFVNLFKVDKGIFKETIEQFRSNLHLIKHEDVLRQLTYSKLFNRSLNTMLIVKLTQNAEWMHTQHETVLQPDQLQDIHVIAMGSAMAESEGKHVYVFGQHDFFGGNNLLDGVKLNYAVRIMANTTLIKLKNSEAKKYPVIGWQLFENCSLHNHLCNIGIYIDGRIQ